MWIASRVSTDASPPDVALCGIPAGYDRAMPESLPAGSLAGADLAERDLSGAALGGRDLRGANLAGADLSDADLAGANLTGADLRGARLEHADLTGATLDSADCARASMSGATLSEASLVGATLRDAALNNSEWRRTQAHAGDWRGCDLSGAVFERVRLDGVDLTGAALTGLQLTDTDIEGACLDEVDGAGLQIVDTSLIDVSAEGARLAGAALRFTDMKRVRLQGADIADAVFESVDFRGTSFEGVTAQGARFERCAGLDRADKRLLEAAGASLPVPLLARIATAIGGTSTATRLALLVLVGLGVGAYVWTSLNRVNPGMREVGPEELVGENRAKYVAFEQKLAADPARQLETLQEIAVFLDSVGAEAAAETKLREALEITDRDEQEPPLEPLLALGDFLLSHERFDDALSFSRELDQPGAGKREVAVSRLLLARTLIARGNAERAAEVATDLVIRVAEVPEELPRFRLAMLAAKIVDAVEGPAAALPLLDAVPPSLGLDEQGEVALERCAMLARMGRIGDAVQGYDLALRSYSDLPLIRERAREERARLLQVGLDPDAEIARLTELADGDDQLAAQSALGLARLAVRRGATVEATAWYGQVRTRHADLLDSRIDATVELAEVLSTGGEVSAAEALLRGELAIVSAPEPGLALRQALAETLHRGGDLNGAVAQARLTAAWASGALKLRARLQLAGLLDEAGAFDEAIDLYKAVALAAEDPGLVAAAWFGQATLLRRRGASEAAVPLMDSALLHLPATHAFRGAIVVERAEVLAELGASSPAAVEEMLADARAAGLPDSQPVAYASLLLLLARELAVADRSEDALTVFQQVASSSAAGEQPGLRQEATQGQVAALVALGRREQATALLDNTSLGALSDGSGEETCEARHGLARGRVEAGEVDDGITDFGSMLQGCRSPRFLVSRLPEISDLLVDRDREDAARALLAGVFDAPEVPAAGRQAAALELGRLGSVDHLDHAAAGPDDALAALARIETAGRLEQAGQQAQARAILEGIAGDAGLEPFPRGLAQLSLGRIATDAGDKGTARVWLVQARDAGDPWLRDAASQALAGLDGGDGS